MSVSDAIAGLKMLQDAFEKEHGRKARKEEVAVLMETRKKMQKARFDFEKKQNVLKLEALQRRAETSIRPHMKQLSMKEKKIAEQDAAREKAVKTMGDTLSGQTPQGQAMGELFKGGVPVKYEKNVINQPLNETLNQLGQAMLKDPTPESIKNYNEGLKAFNASNKIQDYTNRAKNEYKKYIGKGKDEATFEVKLGEGWPELNQVLEDEVGYEMFFESEDRDASVSLANWFFKNVKPEEMIFKADEIKRRIIPIIAEHNPKLKGNPIALAEAANTLINSMMMKGGKITKDKMNIKIKKSDLLQSMAGKQDDEKKEGYFLEMSDLYPSNVSDKELMDRIRAKMERNVEVKKEAVETKPKLKPKSVFKKPTYEEFMTIEKMKGQ